MTSRCSICADRAKRSAVDARLAIGDSPASINKDWPEVASRSALYRHATAHRSLTTLTGEWLDSETSEGEVIGDLGKVRRIALNRYEQLSAAGHDALALRAGALVVSTSKELRESVQTDEDFDYVEGFTILRKIIGNAGMADPRTATALADAADRTGNRDWSKSLYDLAATAADTHSKEK